jgi:hypothetical protein
VSRAPSGRQPAGVPDPPNVEYAQMINPGAARLESHPSEKAVCWAVGTVGPGSAGASTLAVAVATHTAGLLVEADSDGGVLGARYGCWLNESAPSLASLLAALDTQVNAASLEGQFQRLPAGARAALLVPDAEGAAGPVRRLADDLPSLRQRLPGQTLVLDLGRVRPDGPSLRLAAEADVLVTVVKPEVESLGCLLARLPALTEQVRRIGVAVRGQGPYALADIRAIIQMNCGAGILVVPVPDDPRGVAALGQTRPAGRPPRRARAVTALMRSAGALAAVLSDPSPVSAGLAVGTSDRRSSSAAVPLALQTERTSRRRGVR